MIVSAFGGSLPHGVTGANERCTLIVSNLNTDVSFELFKAFGCILSKFLYSFFNRSNNSLCWRLISPVPPSFVRFRP
jgi:hypothetical protein